MRQIRLRSFRFQNLRKQQLEAIKNVFCGHLELKTQESV